jgi:hypothetical protein
MKHLLSRAALSGLALLAAGAVEAATLRPLVTLSGPMVHLRDLFEDAGPNADRVLGPGPGPGGRIIVGATQLGAIARQFGVDWRRERAGASWHHRRFVSVDSMLSLVVITRLFIS